MIVQDIVNAVSTDTRRVLSAAGNDANVIMNWVDRIQKEVLHTSLYITSNMAQTSVTTLANTTSYTLSPPSAIRRLVSVYDITFNRALVPADVVFNPTPVAAKAEESQAQPSMAVAQPRENEIFRYGGTPEYYRFIAPNTFIVTPAAITAAYVATLSITYEQQVQTINNLTTTLTVPDDGKDLIVAGVNWMAFAYIGRAQEAMSWFQLYQQLKAGERVGILR